MSPLSPQFRQVFRRLRKTPTFTAISILTLAAAIGANTAIFSIVNSVLLKPLPFPEPDRLVSIWHTAPGLNIPELNSCPATYFTYRDQSRVFEESGVWTMGTVTITGVAEPERVDSLEVTDGVLPLLGVRPAIGRWFTRADDQPEAAATAMLTYGYWQRRFGGDPSVIGRKVVIDAKPVEIIGVMPSAFRFLDKNPSIVVPQQLDRVKTFIGEFGYNGIARLRPGATIQQADADVARMLPIMMRSFPPAPGITLAMFEQARFGPSVRPLMKDVVGDVGKTLWILMATVGLVLLIACANVASLLLVRAEGRQHELAVRAALGANPAAIARELLMESATLGALGGIVGCGLAYAGLKLLVKFGPAQLPRLQEIGLDGRALLFTAVVSIVAGILFGLIPAWKYTRSAASGALREGGRTGTIGRERHRARSVLVVAQVAMALLLLVCSGLTMRTLQALRRVDPGFRDPEHVQTFRVSIPSAAVKEDERVLQMHRDILAKVAALPGVQSATVSSAVTMDGRTNGDPIMAEDHPLPAGQLPAIRRFKFIGPGYFQTMGNRFIAGRDFTWTDITDKRPYIIVSETIAREFWHDPDKALGKRVRENLNGVWREIIGVVADDHDDGLDKKATATAYWPLLVAHFWTNPTRVEHAPMYVVRTDRAGTAAFLREAEKAVWSVNPELPLANVRTLGDIYNRSMARTSFTMALLGVAAGMALLLGVVGIYGVISYAVTQRTREIGIRIALGAPGSTVQGMFVRYGLTLAGIGSAIGIAASLAVSRVLTTVLFGVSALDPATYLSVAGVLAAAALLASYIPARRAAAIAPIEALRAE